jgi:hypothetical protein
MHVSKIRCDRESKKVYKIFYELNRAQDSGHQRVRCCRSGGTPSPTPLRRCGPQCGQSNETSCRFPSAGSASLWCRTTLLGAGRALALCYLLCLAAAGPPAAHNATPQQLINSNQFKLFDAALKFNWCHLGYRIIY